MMCVKSRGGPGVVIAWLLSWVIRANFRLLTVPVGFIRRMLLTVGLW